MKKKYIVVKLRRGGHPEFVKIIKQMAEIHARKSHDYAEELSQGDPLRNLKLSETLGILPAWKSTFIRILDKVSRLANAFKGKKMKNENIEDTFLDLATYTILDLILYREWKTKNEKKEKKTKNKEKA